MNSLQPLPIDLSTFSKLRNKGYVYVDKTEHAYNLITKGNRYFLSRPRRFGKSLFVSMLKEVFTGNHKLFEGLWIANSDYAWKQHGVITLDFSAAGAGSVEGFQENLCHLLSQIARAYKLDITISTTNISIALDAVTRELYARFGRVAVLIDEYDSPILKTLHKKDVATSIRDLIGTFFTTIKSLDEYIDFVFITGVSSFAKAGIFSGMNNLQILTMQDSYADICGYTDAELNTYFRNHIQAWAAKSNISYEEQFQKIKAWYNGYRFSGAGTPVYNPFSLMNALHQNKFENFWFQSGTPTFLIEEFKKQQKEDPKALEGIIHPETLQLSQGSLGIFDVGIISLPALMFQTGYFTIVDYDATKNSYHLGFPNQEVEKALQLYLLSIRTELDPNLTESMSFELYDAFYKLDIPSIIRIFTRLFSHIPHQIKPKSEREYHSILQAIIAVSGLRSHAEYSTDKGRADIVVELTNATYIIEVKLDISERKALEQIENRKYYQRFLSPKKATVLLGISFMDDDDALAIKYSEKIIPTQQ